MPQTQSQVRSALLKQYIEILSEIKRRRDRNKLATYQPYAKQIEFHTAGAIHHERLLMAGNQLGKTVAGAAEWAMHLSGRYPDWWEGAVFEKPVAMWALGVTNESTRDNPQRLLVGPPSTRESWGTGFIPGDSLVETHLAMGVKNLLDSIVVEWGGGGDIQVGHSVLNFKSYEKGREKLQGMTLDGVWLDEEPPMDIYQEVKARTNNGQNGVFTQITFTPLKGMSEVVKSFLIDDETVKL